MTDGKQGVQVQHKWLWALSPSGVDGKIFFIGHCRNCNLLYSERVQTTDWGYSTQRVNLPEWGCKDPIGL